MMEERPLPEYLSEQESMSLRKCTRSSKHSLFQQPASTPDAPVAVQKDSVGRAFIGYGYDLGANGAIQAISDLTAAGAVINDVTALRAAINALPTKGPATAAEIAAVSAQVSLPNAASAVTLLQETITSRENSFNTAFASLGLSLLPNTQEREALIDLWYQQPAYLIKGSAPNGVPTMLTQALLSGNRAEAWYQIRYGSSANGQQGVGIVARRYLDSQLFGLFANANSPTLMEALQGYQTLTAHRSKIISYENNFGSDPDAVAAIALQPSNQILNANTTYGVTNTQNAVQTLSAIFAPAVDLIMSNYVRTVSPLLASVPDTFAQSTDIFIASGSNPIVDAGKGDGPTQTGLAEASANHIIIGTSDGQSLIGGLGNDILIAGTGNETLTSGLGDDTIVAGGGTDTVNLRAVVVTVDFELQGRTGLHETINANSPAIGTIDVAGVQISGSTATPSLSTNVATNGTDLTWAGGAGAYTYIFDEPTSTLTVEGGALGSNTIAIQKFNLEAAEKGGFLGIQLAPVASLNFAATTGIDPPAPDFNSGATQSYTFSTDAASATARTVTVALSGVNAADFEASAAGSPVTINSDGTFSFALPADQTNISFVLTNTADPGASAPLQLSATLSDPANPNLPGVATNSLTQNFVETSPDPFTTPTINTTSTITGAAEGSSTWLYQDDGQNDLITVTDQPNIVGKNVSALQGGNDVINISGTEPTLVDAGFGSYAINDMSTSQNFITTGGNANSGSVVTLNNNTRDVALLGSGQNQLFGGAATNLASAINTANTGARTNQQGAFLSVQDGNNTIAGSTGNDAIIVGAGNDLILAGPGDDTILGGLDVTQAAGWSASVVGGVINFTNVSWTSHGYTVPNGVTYEGNADTTGLRFAVGNDTIYGGSGNELIELTNGNNYVDVGNGNSTVFGGMGNSTIFGGSGNELVLGGGGSEYIDGGSGNDTLTGRGGNNTIIGGSGNDTIFAGGSGTSYATSETGLNYVDGGTGSDFIFGAGGSDTLIGGMGNVSIQGGAGNENIVGGSGNDILLGGVGNDTISAGGAGRDSIQAGGSSTSTTLIYGGDGTDFIIGGSGSNVIYAGDGGTAGAATSVLASGGDATATTTIYGGLGIDFLQGGAGSSVIYAGDGGTSAAPTSVVASSGATTLVGGLGTDFIQGGNGTDVLYAGDGGTSAAPTTVNGGTGVATLNGGAGPSVLQDTASGADLLVSGSANDTLFGTGNDTLIAGTGDDELAQVAGTATFQFNAGFGNDTVFGPDAFGAGGVDNLVFGPGIAASDFTASATFDANGRPSLVLSGDGGSVAVAGGLVPGVIGSITFLDPSTRTLTQLIQQDGVDSTQQVGTSFDPLTGTIVADNLVLNVDYGASLAGSAGLDTISAWGDNDVLASGRNGAVIEAGGNNAFVTGSSVADVLGAIGHNDTLDGGTGQELFQISDASTVIQDTQKATSDTLQSWVSYTLPSTIQILELEGDAALVGAGNGLADTLSANAGNSTLIAGSAADTLIGGSGNDTFVVNNTADVVQDTAGGANNVLQSSVSDTLPTNVNTLILTGNGNLRGVANSGNDTLISNTGVDTLVGGSGNDVFVVNNAGDVVSDASTTRTNSILSSVSYTLATNIQSLTLTGSANLTATGNAAAGVLTGNAGNDTLIAGSGNETLVAGSGNDTLIAGSGQDVLVGGSGADTYEVNATSGNTLIDLGSGTQTLQFGSGISASNLTVRGALANGVPVITLSDGSNTVSLADELNDGNLQVAFAGGGSESLTQLVQAAQPIATLTGASGNFILNGAGTQVLTGGAGADTLSAWGSADTLNAGTGNQALYAHGANALVNGGSGADTLVAIGQNDTLAGGSGNSTFIILSATDVVQDSSGTALNILQSSVSYMLPTNVNTLTLTGSANLSGTANGGNDTLISNGGIDTLTGGAGNDAFVVHNTADVVQGASATSDNTVFSTASFSLPVNVNTLTLTGTANLVATDNGANDLISANSGNDTLISSTGVDTLVGGAGSDTFVVNNAGDLVQGASATGTNAVQASVSYVLPTNVHTLTLTGTAGLSGTANGGNDTLISNAGVDTLIGGTGSDTFIVNNAADVVQDTVAGVDNFIQSASSYSLPANVDTLILTGSNLIGTGNGDNDTLSANAGNDTLVAGTGNDLLTAASGNQTFQFNAGFGADTISAANATDTLSFGSGINPTDFTVTAVIDNDLPSLVISGDGGSITVDGAFSPGAINNVEFANGSTLSLAQFVAQAASVPATLTGARGNFIFDGSNADTISALGNNDTLAGFGNGQMLDAGRNGNVTEYAWGNNDTLNSQSGFVANLIGLGSSTSFDITGTSAVAGIEILANGSTDTVVAGGPASNYSSAGGYTNAYVLPQTIANLTVAANGLAGIGNALPGVLSAQGTNDTLVATTGTDTLVGIGTGAVLQIFNNSDVIQIQANGTTDSIDVPFSYVLPGNINGLILSGTANLTGTANGGNDTLTSNSGIDTLIGGAGSDTFVVNNSADVVQDSVASANNTVKSSVNYVLPANVSNLILTGSANLIGGANSLNDTLASNFGIDTLVGGAGNDTFVISNSSDVVQDSSTTAVNVAQSFVSYALPTNVNTLVLTGGGLTGRANSAADTLIASSIGFNTLVGGAGNDTFVVNNPGDVVQDNFTGPNNVIQSAVSYTLPTNVNTLFLTGTAAIVGTGNAGNDTLVANAGADTLIAGSGLATLVGGSGSDVFVVNNANDSIQLGTTFGNDTLQSSISYTLPTNVNTLVLTGSSALKGTANSGNDTLISNSGIDTLVGGAGSDVFVLNNASDVIQLGTGSSNVIEAAFNFTLPSTVNALVLTGSADLKGTANNNNDTLVSNSGADTLVGGTGTDLFLVNNASDVVQVGSTHGNDTIQSSVSLALPANVANLQLTGTADIAATGNSLSNVLTAGSGFDTLTPGTGAATLVGGGSTLFVVSSASDVVQEANFFANDTVQSSIANYTLPANVNTLLLGTTALSGTGNSGDFTTVEAQQSVFFHSQTLVAGSGSTELIGGPADDTFVVNSADDFVDEPWLGTSSTIQSSVSYTVPADIHGLILTGTANLIGTDSGFKDNFNTSNDTLVSNSGIDTLIGGANGDVYVVNNASDVIVADHLADTVQSSVSFALPSTVNNLVLTAVNLKGTANAGADTLVAASTGADTLVGGAGNDTFVINNAGDIVQDSLTGFNNTILSSVSTVLPTNVNTLVLTASALKGTANSGADTLIAATAGVNTLVGGAGNDVFEVNFAGDIVQDSLTGFNNTIESAVNFTLPTNVNTLILTGTAALAGTGNAASDTLVANSGADTLTAGSGVATLVGGSGNDLFVVNNANDVVQLGGTFGSDTIQSSVGYTLPTNINTLVLTGSAAIKGVANAGNDTLTSNSGLDTLVGGAGGDTFILNNASDVIQTSAAAALNAIEVGSSYVLPTTVNTLILTGTSKLKGTANSGNDTLVSNTAINTLIGGAGGDTFILNNASDVIQTGSAAALNTIEVGSSYVLPTTVNKLILTGSAALKGTANSAADTLVSNSGIDTLIGGSGNDTFVINNAGDLIQDTASGASNVIQSSVSFVLPVNVNTLTLTGTADLSGTGNAASNVITANAGNDTLTAGSGVATLIGGGGNDTFVVNATGDVVQDTNSGGNNAIVSSVSYTLATNVNTLTLTGSANLKGTANNGNDTLTSNTGVDTLVGGTGNDLFIVNNAADLVQDSAAGAANAVQSSVNYVLPVNVNLLTLTGTAALTGTANSGNDTLVSNTGIDTLIGGSGNDVFIVNNTSDVVQDTAVGANNTLQSSVSFVLPTNVNTLTLTGTANITGTANSGNDTLTASTSGFDTLVGGAGNDTFIINSAGGVVRDSFAGFNNVIESAASLVLPSNINSLILTGSAALSATGNSGNDTLTANSGDDTLTAGTGLATLIGGTGNDTFVLNNPGDVVQLGPIHGNDTIEASFNDTLPTSVNTLVLTGSANLTGTDNGGNDSLVSNFGVDTLVGGGGNDTFVINNSADAVQVGATTGVDTIQSSVSYVLPTNVDNLVLTGSSTTGTGNGDSDTLTANRFSDTLVAGTGPTTLIGAGDDDTFVLANPSDVVQIAPDTFGYIIDAPFSYTLPSTIDELVLTGTANLTGIANDDNDTLTSNSGIDTLVAGNGNDTFIINNAADVVQLGSSSGVDAVISAVNFTLPTGINSITLSGTGGSVATGNSGNDLLTASNTGADTLVAGSGADTLFSSFSGVDTLVGGTGTDTFVVHSGQDVLLSSTVSANSVIESSVSYVLPTNINSLILINDFGIVGTANGGNDLIESPSNGTNTLVGGSGVDVLEGPTIVDTAGQGALVSSVSAVGGSYNDFYAPTSGVLTTGGTHNVISVLAGRQVTLQPTTGAANILSLGGGLDTEALTFSRNGNDLVLTDTFLGGVVTLSGWYASPNNQTVTTLQVIEKGSPAYNAAGSDPLRNQGVYEFNFASLVNQFNQALATNPFLTSWNLSLGIPSAELNTSNTQAYGGDLAYYDGLNGNITGLNLSAIQATLQNAAFGTGLQTIDSFSSISGGPVTAAVSIAPGASTLSDTAAQTTDASSIISAASTLSAAPDPTGTPRGVVAANTIDTASSTTSTADTSIPTTVTADPTAPALTPQASTDPQSSVRVAVSGPTPEPGLVAPQPVMPFLAVTPSTANSSTLSAAPLAASSTTLTAAVTTAQQPALSSPSETTSTVMPTTNSETASLDSPRIITAGHLPELRDGVVPALTANADLAISVQSQMVGDGILRSIAPRIASPVRMSVAPATSSIETPARSSAMSLGSSAQSLGAPGDFDPSNIVDSPEEALTSDASWQRAIAPGRFPQLLDFVFPTSATSLKASIQPTLATPRIASSNAPVTISDVDRMLSGSGSRPVLNPQVSINWSRGLPKSLVDPINVAWLTMHGALDESNPMPIGGSEAPTAHNEGANDALAASAPLGRIHRSPDDLGIHSAQLHQRAM